MQVRVIKKQTNRYQHNNYGACGFTMVTDYLVTDYYIYVMGWINLKNCDKCYNTFHFSNLQHHSVIVTYMFTHTHMLRLSSDFVPVKKKKSLLEVEREKSYQNLGTFRQVNTLCTTSSSELRWLFGFEVNYCKLLEVHRVFQTSFVPRWLLFVVKWK